MFENIQMHVMLFELNEEKIIYINLSSYNLTSILPSYSKSMIFPLLPFFRCQFTDQKFQEFRFTNTIIRSYSRLHIDTKITFFEEWPVRMIAESYVMNSQKVAAMAEVIHYH
jgi:hypothetical protein